MRWRKPGNGVRGACHVVLLEAVWLKLFLDRFNEGRRNADNGRIILADVGFWLVAGTPIILLFNALLPNLVSSDGLTQALMQSVNNVMNTTIGFTLYLIVKYRFPGKIVVKGISIRGLSISIVLLAIAIPTFAVSSLLARNLQLSLATEGTEHAGAARQFEPSRCQRMSLPSCNGPCPMEWSAWRCASTRGISRFTAQIPACSRP